MDKLGNLASRVLFVVAFAFAAIAIGERLCNLLGRTLIFLGGYTPSRLLELAGITLLFVITLQLREIKHLSGGVKG